MLGMSPMPSILIVVADTVEAIRSLSPGPGELVSVCRNLVDRAIRCGPLWWLCAQLLSEPEALATAWDRLRTCRRAISS